MSNKPPEPVCTSHNEKPFRLGIPPPDVKTRFMPIVKGTPIVAVAGTPVNVKLAVWADARGTRVTAQERTIAAAIRNFFI